MRAVAHSTALLSSVAIWIATGRVAATTLVAFDTKATRLLFACDNDICDTGAGPATNGTCFNAGTPSPAPVCTPERLCNRPTAGGCRQDLVSRPGAYRFADPLQNVLFVDVSAYDGHEVRLWSEVDDSVSPFKCSGEFSSTRIAGRLQATGERKTCLTIGLPADYVALPAIEPNTPSAADAAAGSVNSPPAQPGVLDFAPPGPRVVGTAAPSGTSLHRDPPASLNPLTKCPQRRLRA